MSAIATSTASSSVNAASAAATRRASAAAYRTKISSWGPEEWNDNGVSLCIPRVFANIGYKRIFGIFRRLGWGFVLRVDTIRVQPKNGGKPYKRAYVHYEPGRFNVREGSQSLAALEHMIAGNNVQLEYEEDKPWFWKVSLSQSIRPDEAPKPAPKPGVTLAAPRVNRRKVIDIDTTSTTTSSAEVSPNNDPITARMAENERVLAAASSEDETEDGEVAEA